MATLFWACVDCWSIHARVCVLDARVPRVSFEEEGSSQDRRYHPAMEERLSFLGFVVVVVVVVSYSYEPYSSSSLAQRPHDAERWTGLSNARLPVDS